MTQYDSNLITNACNPVNAVSINSNSISKSVIDAAALYAPYIPLQTMATFVPNIDDFTPHINVQSFKSITFNDQEGVSTTVSRDDLIKYIRVIQCLQEEDAIVKTLWDRIQVAVKLIV